MDRAGPSTAVDTGLDGSMFAWPSAASSLFRFHFSQRPRCLCISLKASLAHSLARSPARRRLLSLRLVDTSVLDDRADDESSQMQMETQLPRSICRRCECGGFTQQAAGSRALQWLVKAPSRALGFELAFCQPSCQREAGN